MYKYLFSCFDYDYSSYTLLHTNKYTHSDIAGHYTAASDESGDEEFGRVIDTMRNMFGYELEETNDEFEASFRVD